jgi:hypothetical protein
MSLPRNYKRVLASLAEIIDRNVTELIRLLEEPGMESGIIRREDSFAPAEKEQKLKKLKELREENKHFYKALDTEDVSYSDRQIYNAKITRLWTILHDSRPEKLKGYGTLEEEERKWIAQQVERLLGIIEELK